jgi:hypothetical protein
MNKKESNKVNSFNVTVEVMLKNESIWTGSANVTKQFGLIQGKLPLISVYDRAQNNGEKPSSAVKNNLKEKAIPLAVKLSKSAVAYAAGKSDIALEISVKLTKTGLEKLKDLTLVNTLVKFYNIILPIQAELEHLNSTDVADFGDLVEKLNKAIPQPQVEIDESKTATGNLETLIMEINLMFIELDKFIDPYEYTHPDFYNDYTNSRVVKDLRGKKKDKGDKDKGTKTA